MRAVAKSTVLSSNSHFTVPKRVGSFSLPLDRFGISGGLIKANATWRNSRVTDPTTGQQLWSYKEECEAIPSPLGLNDLVFVPSQGLTALKRQPATSTAEVLWKSSKLDLGNASPVVHGDKVFALNSAGVVSCGSVTDGEVLWRPYHQRFALGVDVAGVQQRGFDERLDMRPYKTATGLATLCVGGGMGIATIIERL